MSEPHQTDEWPDVAECLRYAKKTEKEFFKQMEPIIQKRLHMSEEPCTSSPTTPTGKTPTAGLTSLFHDFRGQMSWGRVCALVALIVAVRA